jgi:hypothetical protein
VLDGNTLATFLYLVKRVNIEEKVMGNNPNWPSKNPGNPSGPGRGNNPPKK